MYTGLVTGTGVMTGLTTYSHHKALTIEAAVALGSAKVGDSIAVNGVCLTITSLNANSFTADVVAETLSKTTLDHLKVGNNVNLELTAKVGDHIGGHMVKGHVDATAVVSELQVSGEAWWLKLTCPQHLSSLVVSKGSIAVDGMSLTVIDSGEGWFSVTLIPHTRMITIAKQYQVGTKVNLEMDIFAKQIKKLMEPYYGRLSKAR